MLRPREARFSWTNLPTTSSATPRLARAEVSSSLSPASSWETLPSDWLNRRTVVSLSASVSMKAWSFAAEENSSSLLSSSVPLRLLKSRIVSWNFVPWPPKFAAV